MLIKELTLRGFMAHEATTLHLPDRGVVVVTGDNGAGKSSLVEAVAWATWGRTVRGAPPWTTGRACHAIVQASTVRVERKRTAKKVTLEWAAPPAAPVTYETTTKAQEALEAVVGDFDRWRRTHLFTVADAWAFGAATDAQRKELLEGLLGLGVFDGALVRCRLDLKVATASLGDARVAEGTVRGRVESLRTALGAVEEVLEAQGPPGDAEALRGRLERLRGMAEATRGDWQAVQLRWRGAQRTATLAEAALHTAKVEAESAPAGTCAACGQSLPEGAYVDHAARIAECTRGLERAQQCLGETEAELRDLQMELTGLDEQIRAVGAEAQRVQAWTVSRVQATATTAKLRGELVAVEGALAERGAQVLALGRRVALLSTVEGVLGLRGVRAQVLDGALRAIEHVANVWLARIAGENLRLTLRSSTERKSGGVVDAIAMDVTGVGGGHGYAGASAGERRRMDIALLFAFAEVAGAAAGTTPGTLWFDDVFDVLDDDGAEAVAGALADLAAERPVVVVGPSPALAARLSGARHLRVTGGLAAWA